ncbi:MAG TPA: hypothetical protein VFB21_07655 [Chthonomonadaceae bacterium]|jgi:hypothetical protein|nr:hypothetical protein [Chthonomonadaceae bacterium]
MSIRFGRIGGAVAVGTLLALTAAPSLAQAPQEDTLLGIRLMAPFSTVLRKYGQPNEIQIGAPTTPAQAFPATAGTGAAGGPGMGIPGMPGRGGLPGMMGGPGMMGVPGGYRGMPGGMAPGAGRPGMMGGPGMMGPDEAADRGGLPGFAGGRPAAMSGMPGGYRGMMPGGMTPGMGAPGMPPGMGRPGMMGQPGNPAYQGNPTEGEITWWYHFPQKGLHYSFLLNKEGRVIQIQEYGWTGGSKTRRGIGLGSTLGQIIQKYGWTTNGEPAGENLLLRYGGRNKVAFQLVKNKVVGITVAVVK